MAAPLCPSACAISPRHGRKFIIELALNDDRNRILFYILGDAWKMIDDLDRRLLALLQQDATLTVAQLSERVGLPVTVFVSIRTSQHDEKWLNEFAAAVSRMPEVIELYRMSGEVDYLMKVVTSDIGGYDRFYKRLIKSVKLNDVSSTFAMEQIKYSTEVPLDAVQAMGGLRRGAGEERPDSAR